MKELLTGNLPNSFLIGGREYHISSDFRAMLRLEEIFSSEKLTDEEKAERALKLFYGCIPEPLEEAVERLCYFWSCGRQEQEGRAKGEGAAQPPIYSFAHDAGLIYGAFLTQYGFPTHYSYLAVSAPDNALSYAAMHPPPQMHHGA